MSAETANMYLTALRNFSNWLVKEKRFSENPAAHMAKLNAATDRRRERRPYTTAELGRILAAAEAGPKIHGMTGPVRALLYRTATEKGLRWSELRSLTRASFDFVGEPATVTIRPEDAKNRKEAVLPLRPALAADLKAHMALLLSTAKVFPGMGDKGAEMLRVDLDAAGISYVDEYGCVGDFHSFRHAYGTLGAKAGIPLATMQKRPKNWRNCLPSPPSLQASGKLPLRPMTRPRNRAKSLTAQLTVSVRTRGLK